MMPLCDLHCHLLAGLDDGPRSDEEALTMCRIAYDDGVRTAAAGAHQNDRWPQVTPARIREATRRLVGLLREAGVPLTVFPCAEVMAHLDVAAAWRRGELLSVADRGDYLLLEMPHGLAVDLRPTAGELQAAGVRPILAHPERQPELLHEAGRIEGLIRAGCLVQVNCASVTDPPCARDERALRDWFRRGVVHFLGSDGHSPRTRPPRMAKAYGRVARWAGAAVADRVGGTNGLALAHGLPVQFPPPAAPSRSWFLAW